MNPGGSRPGANASAGTPQTGARREKECTRSARAAGAAPETSPSEKRTRSGASPPPSGERHSRKRPAPASRCPEEPGGGASAGAGTQPRRQRTREPVPGSRKGAETRVFGRNSPPEPPRAAASAPAQDQAAVPEA